MYTEIGILGLYGLFVLATIVAQVVAAMGQVGLAYLASPRDAKRELNGVPGRLDRAQANSVFALALFAPAVLGVVALGATGSDTVLAAQLFLAGRVAYLAFYVLGTHWLRTISWTVGALATAWLYLAMI